MSQKNQELSFYSNTTKYWSKCTFLGMELLLSLDFPLRGNP
jgi:hypothetical protein